MNRVGNRGGLKREEVEYGSIGKGKRILCYFYGFWNIWYHRVNREGTVGSVGKVWSNCIESSYEEYNVWKGDKRCKWVFEVKKE